MAFQTAPSFPNPLLAHYSSQLEHQRKILDRVRGILPDPLAQHVFHCVKNEKKLLIYTDSAAWASQIRFYKDAILTAFAAMNGPTVEDLQIRIFRDVCDPHTKSVEKPNIPSPENILLIRNQSENAADEELKQALQKLGATLARL